jgi:mono/diheme cytochrome c family protein
VLCLALWGCSERTPTEPPPLPPAAAPAAEAPPTQPVADPAAYRGAAIAGQVCAQCHNVGTAPPVIAIPGATAFSEVARRPETTPESLAAWLRSSHPSMPNYIFGESETADIVAFIISLRQ